MNVNVFSTSFTCLKNTTCLVCNFFKSQTTEEFNNDIFDADEVGIQVLCRR